MQWVRTVKNQSLPEFKIITEEKAVAFPRAPLCTEDRAANPAATSLARGPHLARGRPGPVQQRCLLVRLPRPSKQRRRLLIIAVSAGPRYLLRDVGHGPLRTKLY